MSPTVRKVILLKRKIGEIEVDDWFELADLAIKHQNVLDWHEREELAERGEYLLWFHAKMSKKDRQKMNKVRDELIKGQTGRA
jgi:hypothetical protein